LKLSCHTITWGGVVGHPAGVTSVKDLFYLANGPSEPAIRQVAEAGYLGVELFDGNLAQYEHQIDDLRRLLAETDIRLVAVYSGANFVFEDILEEELWRIDKAASLAAQLNAEHLVVGGGARRAGGASARDYDRLADALDQVVAIAAKHSLLASYHPHLGTIVERPEQLDQVMLASRIHLCPDTAHLAAGGGNPVELIQRYGERIVYVHLKDYRSEPLAFLPLGRGELDVKAILSGLDAAGYDGWVTVELDDYAGPPIEAARKSRLYLEQVLAEIRE